MNQKKLEEVQKLTALARSESTTVNERLSAALQALAIVEKYNLHDAQPSKDPFGAAVARYTSPEFVEGVATRIEAVASGFERVVGSVRRVSQRVGVGEPGRRADEDDRPRRRRRRFG